jgi:hypothetical protein
MHCAELVVAAVCGGFVDVCLHGWAASVGLLTDGNALSNVTVVLAGK